MQVRSPQFYSVCFVLFLCFSSSLSLVRNFNEEEGEDIKRSQFPDGFFFGTATSSYQIEGAYLEDGKTLNNWDVFTHRKGNIDEENGDVADDHYHHYLEDIEMMHSLGVNAYRFSISWARVLPRGRFGEVNPTGVSFYNKILDNLLLKGIEPFVTIYHGDFPQELEDRYGSWLSPQMQEDFLYFAETCFKSFGNRVKYWITINEPNLFTDMSYMRGKYPPARCSVPFGNCSAGDSDVEPLVVMHNMLLAHAKAVKIYREHFQPKQGGVIGIVVCAFMYVPMTESELDREAANRALAFNVAWTFDPLVFGDYPPEMRHYHGSELPRFSPEEREYIKGSIDFIGINHYSTFYTKDCIYSSCILGGDRPIRGFVNTTGERNGVPIGDRTGMVAFFVVPRGMEEIVNYVKERYHNKPMYILENGYSPPRQQDVQVQDLLNDVKRVEFHKAYLASLARAIKNGADVRGYFVWALMDNYEWVEGYSLMFGLYYVDRQTLKRIPKLSAKWYNSFLTNSSHQNREPTRTSSFGTKNVIGHGLQEKQLGEM
ncbi:Beta-glucosidase [Actinidia chinensis var. chinensis]|uniref:Beta-glucosidase n=1 Tax=Actinidia chinensis var. chinensis TaxID=1590841 RepID=A0A2R6QE22_ACTCC|nr:Beta-glucosidase [Actinidia chinensis var. chinensis]